MATTKNGNGRPAGRATIRDIAEMAGVSIATVSRVLNRRPDVSEETRELVMHYVREHGYVANPSARGLTQQRTGLIGATVPVVHSEYFNHILSGAADALYERDARIVLCPTLHEHDREVSLLERVMHGTTDGALLVLPSESNEELLRVRATGFHFVVIDNSAPLDDTIPVVAAAHWSGARLATEYLLELGHQRIAAITGPPTWVASRDRLAGFHTAMLQAGRAADALVYEGDFLVEGGYRAACQFLRLPNPPTAVFAFNDNMAMGTLQAARELRLDVPGDLSVIGFDDIDLAGVLNPPLTSVRQPLQEMGRVASSLLFRLLDGQRVDATRVELSTRLMVRSSTGPPRDSRT
ncbi:MAG TPA: LacI family DNA-binding transcriptional regulator [Chloroflexota bacterium]